MLGEIVRNVPITRPTKRALKRLKAAYAQLEAERSNHAPNKEGTETERIGTKSDHSRKRSNHAPNKEGTETKPGLFNRSR